MAADSHVTGTLYLLAGKSVSDYRVIAALDSEVADNAAGSEPYYLIPAGAPNSVVSLPRNDGVPIALPAGPHVIEGEMLMLGIATDSTSLADVDTTGAASDIYNLEYWEYDRTTQRLQKRLIRDETTRQTQTGLAPQVDPDLIQNQVVITHAWGPVAPNNTWTLAGRVRLDLRTAT